MSGEVLVRIRPGESVDEFTSRVADSAPSITPDLADRLRSLLAVNTPVDADTALVPQLTRNAA
jgi:hypothetical protein